MAQDSEMPCVMGILHNQYTTPYVGVWIMVIISAIIGTIGVTGGVVALTGVTLASNLGTFVLYALICGITFVAFSGNKEFHRVRHSIIPFVGLVVNLLMVGAIFILGILAGGTTAQSTYLTLAISVGWLIVCVIYYIATSARQGKSIVPAVTKQ